MSSSLVPARFASAMPGDVRRNRKREGSPQFANLPLASWNNFALRAALGSFLFTWSYIDELYAFRYWQFCRSGKVALL
jgi:hypothetical protein